MNRIDFRGRGILSLCLAIAVTAIWATPRAAHAQIVPLSDGNSLAYVDLGSDAGMYNWSVDGQNQLNKQWFWYRVGSGVAAPINTISTASYSTTGTDQLSATYTGSGWKLTVNYKLTGGSLGSGTADIEESIMFTNYSGGSLDFHLYQYSDFNLLGTPGGDQVFLDGNPIDGYTYAFQMKGLTQIAEAINLPAGNHAEANVTPNTLNSLNSTADLILNDSTYASGDVTWALQWDKVVADGEQFDVFKDKLLSIEPIPEPSSLSLIGLGLLVLGVVRRSRRS